MPAGNQRSHPRGTGRLGVVDQGQKGSREKADRPATVNTKEIEMNTLVEMLNVWGGRFMDAAWPMLWQSGVLIAVVFALDLALRKRVRATTRYALWLLVLAKLVVPTSLSLPTGVAYWLPAPQPVVASSLWLDNNRRRAPTLQPETDLGAGQTLHSDVASSLWLDKNRRAAPTLQPETDLGAAKRNSPMQRRPPSPPSPQRPPQHRASRSTTIGAQRRHYTGAAWRPFRGWRAWPRCPASWPFARA